MKYINPIILIIIYLFFFIDCNEYKKDKPIIIDMNDNWVFSKKNKNDWKKAIVPGCVHTDLFKNGDIEDPFYRDNEDSLQWIGKEDWVYRKKFQVQENFLNRENIEIVFEGLDTYADVFLNGKKIITADNMFRIWRKDCRSILLVGKNELKIVFFSADNKSRELRNNAKMKLFNDYAFSRKAPYHFGWDWGPVFVTSGIWRPVYLKGWNNLKINSMRFIQKELEEKNAHLQFEFEIQSEIVSEAQIHLKCENKQIKKNIDLKKGDNFKTIDLHLKDPELWWPNGLGKQNLYNISAEIVIGNKIKDSISDRIGLRTIKLIQKKDDIGKGFYFEINGHPVFMKGANYIPGDLFLNRVSDKEYRTIVKSAKDANMNMLRVWGGGIYENKKFYDLCDEMGLLVWQDFMFACALYPGDEDFLKNVREEAVDNLKRLRNHPSIALWCGNNEILNGWKDWGWQSKFSKEESVKVWDDYKKLFHKLLPEIINKYDNRDYWPSSPKYGWAGVINRDGDVHYWGVWHGQLPFEYFEKTETIGRFMSEYGFQACPDMKTIKSFTIPSDREISSKIMKKHQKHRIGYPVIDKYFKLYYQKPKDFESYVYLSQVMQARGIGQAISAHRRAMPFCMGTLYWQLNDCYPVTSWSSIDSEYRWKALHYRVRDLYKKIIISPFLKKEKLEIYIISDHLKDKTGSLELTLKDFKGKVLWKKNFIIEIKANTSKMVFKIDQNELLKNINSSQSVLITKLKDKTKIIDENYFYFEKPKDLFLKAVKPNIKMKRSGRTYRITLSSKYLLKNIHLNFEEVNGFFSNNYFDLLPGEDKEIQFTTRKETDLSISDLRIVSLINTYK